MKTARTCCSVQRPDQEIFLAQIWIWTDDLDSDTKHDVKLVCDPWRTQTFLCSLTKHCRSTDLLTWFYYTNHKDLIHFLSQISSTAVPHVEFKCILFREAVFLLFFFMFILSAAAHPDVWVHLWVPWDSTGSRKIPANVVCISVKLSGLDTKVEQCVRCSDADLTGLWSDMFSPLGLSLNLVSSAFSLRCWFWLDHPDPVRSSLVLRASYWKKLLWIRMHGHLRNLLSSLRTTESGKHGHYLAAIDCFYCFIVKFLFYLHVYMTFLLPHRSLFIYFVVLFILYSHF